ncbi:glycosyltransferase family 4 protein [Azospirillum sp. SYSU D00513]|uniref:glycosyltransferase family 4 protein n=1 Tax=Azospirillum sp. SYSU D00513 TaxID=2812561 RepID=UPI001A9574B3|nr:glycosyltransferase family 4 protein [Azospirillum sp. SYSU D00513]
MRNNHKKTCIVFTTPGALEGGGGIGRMTGYIVDQFEASAAKPDTVVLDTRGKGSVWMSPLYLTATLARLGWLAARGRASIVHINVSEGASVPRKAAIQFVAKLFGRPTVVHLHGATFIDYCRESAVGRAMSRWLFRHCDRAVVLGKEWSGFLAEELGIAPQKIRILYNAVPDFAADGLEREPPPQGATLSLLVLANLSERKGIGTLLHACEILKQRGVRFRLTLGGGGDVDGYREMAARLGIAEDCSFHGWVSREQAHEMLRSHDMLVLPSTHEGLPMVILEALAARLPVVTTPVGSIPEVLKHAETAMIVPVNEREALADSILELAGDPDLYRRLSEEGRRLFVRLFDIGAYADALNALYEEMQTPERRTGLPEAATLGSGGLGSAGLGTMPPAAPAAETSFTRMEPR